MGKGDKRSKRGKIFRGSYGKTRLRKKKSSQKFAYSTVKNEKRIIDKKDKPVESFKPPVTEMRRVEKKIEQAPAEVQVHEELKPELPAENTAQFEEKPPEIIETQIAVAEIVEEASTANQTAEYQETTEEIIPEPIISGVKSVEDNLKEVITETVAEPLEEKDSTVETEQAPAEITDDSESENKTKKKVHPKKETVEAKPKSEKKKSDETKTTKRGRPKKKKD